MDLGKIIYLFGNQSPYKLYTKSFWGKEICGRIVLWHPQSLCVNHEILLAKLETYGISGSSKKLIQSYLKDRYQRVVISNDTNINSNSSWTLVKHGVPLLFLIYINDLAFILRKHANPFLFADDTSVIISSSNENESLLMPLA